MIHDPQNLFQAITIRSQRLVPRRLGRRVENPGTGIVFRLLRKFPKTRTIRRSLRDLALHKCVGAVHHPFGKVVTGKFQGLRAGEWLGPGDEAAGDDNEEDKKTGWHQGSLWHPVVMSILRVGPLPPAATGRVAPASGSACRNRRGA